MVENTSNTNNNDTQNQNNDSNNQNNNTGGSHIYLVGMDTNESADSANIQKFCKALEDCGNKVYISSIASNQEGVMPGLAKKYNADTCIFLCAVAPVTVWSFTNAVKAGTLPHTIFGFEGWVSTVNGMEGVQNYDFFQEWDSGQFMDDSKWALMRKDAEAVNAKTLGEWANANSEYVTLCWGESPEELAQNICSGSCGGGGGNITSSSGGAQIKDKTFEHCIRRICAATDSVFIVENNAAVLFPYTDWMAFTLRQQINQIKAKEMDPDLFSIEYNNDGFYNKVTTVFGADDTNQNKQTEDKQQLEETTTNGNVTKIKKSMPSGGTQLSEQYDSLVKIYGVLEKKVTTNFPDEETAQYVTNALLIQYIRDFNNSCHVRVLNNKKYIGGTFYAVQNPNTKESELFFLNSYTLFKSKNQPLALDMEFKYGPEGAEELLDYQSFGGGSSGAQATDTAQETQIWKEAAKIHYGHDCSAQDPLEAYNFLKGHEGENDHTADCYGMSSYLHYRFNNQANIPCRVVGDSSHHVVMLYKNNAWQETRNEYKSYNFEHLFNWKTNQNTTVLLEANNPPAGSSTDSTPSGNTTNK